VLSGQQEQSTKYLKLPNIPDHVQLQVFIVYSFRMNTAIHYPPHCPPSYLLPKKYSRQ